MQEKEEIFNGEWFIPGSQIKAHGKLTVTNNGINLYITDPTNRNLTSKNEEDNIPLIYGIGEHREVLTLFNCSGFSGSYDANLMIFGNKHYSEFESLKFKLIQIIIPSFDSWINSKSFKKEDIDSGFQITYKKTEPITYKIDNNLTLQINFHCQLSDINDISRLRKFNLSETTQIQLISSSDEGYTLKEFLKTVTSLQSFISFISEDGCNVEFINAFSDEKEFLKNPFMGNIIYALLHYNKYEENNFSRNRYLITYDDIKGDFSGIMKNWFEFITKSPSIMNLVLYDYFYKGPFDENRFLNVVRALEIFHANFYIKETISNKISKETKKLIINTVPKEFEDEIKDWLSNVNTTKLHTRLEKLTSEFNSMNLEKQFDADFIMKAKESRNYYTHLGVKKKNVVDGNELLSLTEDCRTLLTFVILKQLGVNIETLKKIFNNYIPMSHYSRYF